MVASSLEHARIAGRRLRAVAAALLGPLAVLAVSGGALAQDATLRARVIDAESLRPIPGASVILLDSMGVRRGNILADSTGVAAFSPPGTGPVRFQVRRENYFPLISELHSRLPSDSAATIALVPQVSELSAGINRSGAREWGQDGFARRKVSESGIFLTREDILRNAGKELVHSFAEVPGVKVSPGPGSFGGFFLEATEGWRCVVVLVNRLPVPGVPLAYGNPRVPFPDAVMAVELYRHSNEVPDEFRRFANPDPRVLDMIGGSHLARPPNPCGLLNIWTVPGWAPAADSR